MIILIMINKSPIYQQLSKALRKRISEEKYTEGDKFITERAVCEIYEVSRATANKALSSLVTEGMLEFKKGVGTFIKSKPNSAMGISVLTDFTTNAIQAGITPTLEILNSQLLTADEINRNIAERLQVTGDEHVFRIEQLNLNAGIPAAIEYRYIVARFCPNLLRESLKTSLHTLFIDKYDLAITCTEERIYAVNLQNREAELLDSELGTAAFSVRTVGFTDGEIPLWFTETFFKPEGFEFLYTVEKGHMQDRFKSRMIFLNKE